MKLAELKSNLRNALRTTPLSEEGIAPNRNDIRRFREGFQRATEAIEPPIPGHIELGDGELTQLRHAFLQVCAEIFGPDSEIGAKVAEKVDFGFDLKTDANARKERTRKQPQKTRWP